MRRADIDIKNILFNLIIIVIADYFDAFKLAILSFVEESHHFEL
jgi:hypothetical protein